MNFFLSPRSQKQHQISTRAKHSQDVGHGSRCPCLYQTYVWRAANKCHVRINLFLITCDPDTDIIQDSLLQLWRPHRWNNLSRSPLLRLCKDNDRCIPRHSARGHPTLLQRLRQMAATSRKLDRGRSRVEGIARTLPEETARFTQGPDYRC